jgi:hypothetical protein
MYVHARLPSGMSGRPGQRRLVSTGCGSVLIARPPVRAVDAELERLFGAGSGVSTAPSTVFGRYGREPLQPDFHAFT